MSFEEEEYRRGYEEGQEAGPAEQFQNISTAIAEPESYIRGYKDGLNNDPYSPKKEGPEEEANTTSEDDYEVDSGSTSSRSSSSASSSKQQPLENSSLKPLVHLYFGLSGAAWLVYFVLLGLVESAVIPPETAESLQHQFQSILESPIGFILIIIFSIGMIITGLFALIIVVPLGLLVVLAERLPLGIFAVLLLLIAGLGLGWHYLKSSH